MVVKLGELAVAVVFAGEGHAVVTPCQQAAVFDQHRGMAGPGMGIAGQFRRPLCHLLRHMAVLTVERPPLGLLPWLHACPPFAAKTSGPARKFAGGQRSGCQPASLRQPAGTIRARTRIEAEAEAVAVAKIPQKPGQRMSTAPVNIRASCYRGPARAGRRAS